MTDAADRYIARCRAALANHKRQRAAAARDKSLTATDRIMLLASQDAEISQLDALLAAELNAQKGANR